MKKIFIAMAFCFVCIGCLFGCALFPKNCEINVVNLTTNGGTATSSEEYKQGEEITLIARPNQGYYFEGWKDEEGNVVSFKETFTFEVEKSMDLTVSFKEGKSLLIDDTKLIGTKGGDFEVDAATRKFSLKHADGNNRIGYWYEGEDNGHTNEVSSKNISFDDVVAGAYYQFHEGVAFFYGVAKDDDAYSAFLNNTSKETLDSMVQAGDILLSHEVDETTETTEITETFDVSDGQTTITAVIYVDGEGNKQVIPAPGTLYTGISYTNTDSFILGAKTFRITVSAS